MKMIFSAFFFKAFFRCYCKMADNTFFGLTIVLFDVTGV